MYPKSGYVYLEL